MAKLHDAIYLKRAASSSNLGRSAISPMLACVIGVFTISDTSLLMSEAWTALMASTISFAGFL